MALIDVKVPDIGDFSDVPVIEILVKPGRQGAAGGSADHARKRQGDDGSSVAGSRARLPKMLVKVGDKVSEGTDRAP